MMRLKIQIEDDSPSGSWKSGTVIQLPNSLKDALPIAVQAIHTALMFGWPLWDGKDGWDGATWGDDE